MQPNPNGSTLEQTVKNSGRITSTATQSLANKFHLVVPADIINEDVLEVHNDLIDLIGNYLELRSPVPVLTQLLQCWLDSPLHGLPNNENDRDIKSVLRLIDFWVELRETYRDLQTLTDIAMKRR